MTDWVGLTSGDRGSVEAQRARARADADAAAAAVKEFLGERGTLVDTRGLSELEYDLIKRAVMAYGTAHRILQESPDSVILKVRRLMEDGVTSELAGARRQLVNEAVTWAIKAYYDADQRGN